MRVNLNASMSPGPYREETLNGREYIVVNMTLIVPGVLDGSNGPLLYEEEELARDPDLWNGIPLIAYHPEIQNDDGEVVATSARDPHILAKSQIGYNYRTEYKDNALRSEGWFDKELTANYDANLPEEHRMLPRLLNGQPIELSTGLFAENLPAKGTHNGTPYHYVARNYKADHIAILPDQQGACSVKDGCGTNITTQKVNNCRYNYRGLCVNCGQIRNNNPKGCNQYTGKGCSISQHKESTRVRDFVTEMGLDPNKISGDDLNKAVNAFGKKWFTYYTPDKFLEVLARTAPEEAKTPLAPPVKSMPQGFKPWGDFAKGYTEDEMKDMADKIIAHVGEESFTAQVDWLSQNSQPQKNTGLQKRPQALRAKAAFEQFISEAANAAGQASKADDVPAHMLTESGGLSGAGRASHRVSDRLEDEAWARAWNIAKGTLLNNRKSCIRNCYGLCVNCGGKGGKPGPCPKGSTASGGSKGDNGSKSSSSSKSSSKSTAQKPTKQKAFRNPAEANKLSGAADAASKAANIRQPQPPKPSQVGGVGVAPHEEVHASYLKKQKDAADAHEKAEKEHKKLADIRGPTSSRHASIAEHHKTMKELYKKRQHFAYNTKHDLSVYNLQGHTMKEKLIKWLTVNCDCWKGKEKVLENFEEENLKEFKSQFIAKRVTNAAAAKWAGAFTTNAEGEGEVAGFDYATLAEFFSIEVDITKDPVGFIKALRGKLQEVMDALDHSEPAPSPEPAPAVNTDDEPALNAMDDVGPAKDPTQTSNRKKMTRQEFINMMPDEFKEPWNNFVNNSRQERIRLLNQITNGATPAEKKILQDAYKGMPLEQLKLVAKRMGMGTAQNNNQRGYLPEDNLPTFGGGSGYSPDTDNEPVESDILESPVQNFSRKERFAKHQPNHLTVDDNYNDMADAE